jgi:predicted permease
VHGATALALLSIASQSVRIANQERRAHRTLRLSPTVRRGVDPMMLQDLRFAVRMLWKRPGFTLTAITVLALSIGANTAIFSLVHGVLLRPLPYRQPERIVAIHETTTRGRATVSPPNFVDWQAQNSTFAVMDAYDSRVVTLSEGATPERIDAAIVGGTVFDVLGVPPLLGRTFSSDELRTGGPAAVILGHELWQRRFGADPGIVGRSILIDARPRVVAGVMPAGFDFPDGFELWMPLVFTPDELVAGQRGAHYVEAIGRLKAGVTREQAEADIAAIESRIAAEHPDVQGYGIWLEPIYDAVVGEYRRPLWMLLGAVGFVLLIGCANISNLLLARGASRRT